MGNDIEGHTTGEEFPIEQQAVEEMFENFPSLPICVCVCGFSFKLFHVLQQQFFSCGGVVE